MKSVSVRLQRSLAFIIFFTFFCTVSFAEDILPRISIDDAPLSDTIRTLARQANLNCILDPNVPGSDFEPGKSATQPNVKAVWTNTTAKAALDSLLKDYKLKIVNNPVTTVCRIAPDDLEVNPIPASSVGMKISKTVPLMALETVPLTVAITTIARSGNMDVAFSPEVLALDSKGTVSFRWEKITVPQAMAALLDNYGLVMTEDPKTLVAHISMKGKKE